MSKPGGLLPHAMNAAMAIRHGSAAHELRAAQQREEAPKDAEDEAQKENAEGEAQKENAEDEAQKENAEDEAQKENEEDEAQKENAEDNDDGLAGMDVEAEGVMTFKEYYKQGEPHFNTVASMEDFDDKVMNDVMREDFCFLR